MAENTENTSPENNKKAKEKKVRRTLIGGQALMEGVMMRGKSAMAMAVRTPDGDIELETKRLKNKGAWYKKVPIVRGVVAFVSSLITGMGTLLKSAEVSGEEDETPSGGMMAIAVVLGVVLAVGLFILLPSFLTSLFERFISNFHPLLSGLIEGLLRILIFVLYLFIVSRLKDIRRTFMYHGAEHRTINCYEKGMEMTVENVQKCSTKHNRCGTTFLFFVVVLSILVFALTNFLLSLTGLEIMGTWYMRLLVRIALLPVVAGLSYELLRGLAALPDNKFTNVLRAPGLALQRLTTYPPDDDMAEVALKSFLAVLKMDEDESIPEQVFFEHPYADVKRDLKQKLAEAGKPESDFEFMLGDILGLKRGQLFDVKKLDAADYRKLRKNVSRRIGGEPLDYILGYSEFMGERITVGESVLCPRPETELLCERALEKIGEGSPKTLDLCTGSGCIAKALSKTNAVLTAADFDDKALEVARENLKDTGVEVVKSDMLSAFENAGFDIIVSNPPYIKSADMESLEDEVKAEPEIALDGGEDGLAFYRRIASGLKQGALKEGGTLFLEIGYDIGAGVKELFEPLFENVSIIKDYSQNDRMIVCENFVN